MTTDKNSPAFDDAALRTQLLHALGKDHMDIPAMRQLLSGAARAPGLALLGRITQGQESGISPYQQANAIYALGMLGDRTAVPWLTDLLDGADSDTQVLAVRALGRIGSDQALEPVRRRYNGPVAPDKAAADPAQAAPTPPLAAAAHCSVPPALGLEMRDALRGAALRSSARAKRVGRRPTE